MRAAERPSCMTTKRRVSTGLLVAVAATAVAHAEPDPRFMRMWQAAQRLRPATLATETRIAPESEPGTPLVVRGLVLDVAGHPAPGIEVFAYHTDAAGRYAAPGAEDPWRLKGWAVTDARGRFEFHTIRPGAYPGRTVPAHIHVTTASACCGHQLTDLMFDDDPLATPAYRDHFAAAGEHGLYGAVRTRADGGQEVTYTIRLRPRGDF